MQISKKQHGCELYASRDVIHTILWKFANLRLTSPSGPIRYTILKRLGSREYAWEQEACIRRLIMLTHVA